MASGRERILLGPNPTERLPPIPASCVAISMARSLGIRLPLNLRAVEIVLPKASAMAATSLPALPTFTKISSGLAFSS